MGVVKNWRPGSKVASEVWAAVKSTPVLDSCGSPAYIAKYRLDVLGTELVWKRIGNGSLRSRRLDPDAFYLEIEEEWGR